MAAAPDYYAMLGVTPDADQAVIRAAWKALLRKYHPDTAHVGELLVFLDRIADLDVPGDDLGFCDAFTDVGQAKFKPGHADQSFMIFLSACPIRTGPGK